MVISSLPTSVIDGSSQKRKIDAVADGNVVVIIELQGIIYAIITIEHREGKAEFMKDLTLYSNACLDDIGVC